MSEFHFSSKLENEWTEFDQLIYIDKMTKLLYSIGSMNVLKVELYPLVYVSVLLSLTIFRRN